MRPAGHAVIIAALAACSHADDPARVAKLERALDGLGDKFAADARALTAHLPKSRIGAADVLAEMTPDGLSRQVPTLAQFDVNPLEVAQFLNEHPDAIEHMMDRAGPALEQLLRAMSTLPLADPEDCAALDREVAALQKGLPADRAYARTLAAGLPSCVPCMGSGNHAGCGSPPDAAN